MSQDEFASWLPGARDRYARDIARSGRGSDEEAARRRAVEETDQLVASPFVVYEPVEVFSAAAVEREP